MHDAACHISWGLYHFIHFEMTFFKSVYAELSQTRHCLAVNPNKIQLKHHVFLAPRRLCAHKSGSKNEGSLIRHTCFHCGPHLQIKGMLQKHIKKPYGCNADVCRARVERRPPGALLQARHLLVSEHIGQLKRW